MSTIKINWGAKIAMLYGGFVVLIVILVTGSMRQDFDLVSADYYQQELEYQKVIDASKNQSALSSPVQLHADGQYVYLDFPQEVVQKTIAGNVQFYSEVKTQWDKTMPLTPATGKMTISRSELQKTNYLVKISWNADGVDYYQETRINLTK